jgi:hypothetical protein
MSGGAQGRVVTSMRLLRQVFDAAGSSPGLFLGDCFTLRSKEGRGLNELPGRRGAAAAPTRSWCNSLAAALPFPAHCQTQALT